MPISYLQPSVGLKGVMKLGDPFAAQVVANVPYTVAAVRRLSDIITSGTDAFEAYYFPNNIEQSKYEEDIANGVCILSLQSPTDQWVYVPNSYLLSMPAAGGVPYSNMMVAVNLGAIPNRLSLNYFMETIKAMAHDQLGIDNADVRSAVVSPTTYIDPKDSDLYEIARKNIMSAISTDRAKLLASEAAREKAIAKIAELEDYIRKNLTP